MFLSTGPEHCDPEDGCIEPRSRREVTTQMASRILRGVSLVLAVVGLGAGVWEIGCTSRWDLMRPAGATPEETCRCLQCLYRFSKVRRNTEAKDVMRYATPYYLNTGSDLPR